MTRNKITKPTIHAIIQKKCLVQIPKSIDSVADLQRSLTPVQAGRHYKTKERKEGKLIA